MNKYAIRFNKTRGLPGRGSVDHVWRVFENDNQEYVCKHLDITVPVKSEKDANDVDYNICCYGFLAINWKTSTAQIRSTPPNHERQETPLQPAPS